MTPFCESCGAHTSWLDEDRNAKHTATCPYNDPVFAQIAARFLAGVDVRVAEFEAVQS